MLEYKIVNIFDRILYFFNMFLIHCYIKSIKNHITLCKYKQQCYNLLCIACHLFVWGRSLATEASKMVAKVLGGCLVCEASNENPGLHTKLHNDSIAINSML